jgi:hypothetical protein
MICLLYKVADNVEYDSYEHIEEFAKEINKKIKKSKILDTKVSSDSSDDKTTPDNANQNDQANPDSGYTYRYSFAAGMLVLRTKNYDDVIRADAIPESERKEYGFWSAENTDSYIQYNNLVFCTEGSSEENIVRYNSKGMDTQVFKSDGYLKLIVCEDDCLYFHYYNSEEKIERYYRINNCTSNDYSVDCLAEMVCASYLDNNSGNSIFKSGEWIYFLYTEDSEIRIDDMDGPELWLYRLSENTGAIEQVSSIYHEFSSICKEITRIIEQNGHYILEGVMQEGAEHYRTRCFFLFDPVKSTCSQLCFTGCVDSEFDVMDGMFYHLHQNHDGTVCWAKTDMQGEAPCETISILIDGDVAHSDVLSNLNIWGNTMLYSSYGGDSVYTSYMSYCIDLTGANSAFEIEATQYMPNIYVNNGIIYMFVNGAVVYSNVEHPDKWYDSGVRYIKRSMMYGFYLDRSFFTERNGQVYFITCDYCALLIEGSNAGFDVIDLNDYYNSIPIQTDFLREIEVDSPIFQPHADAIQPSCLESASLLTYSVRDKWGNNFGSSSYSEDNSLGIVFVPSFETAQTVQYNTDGVYNYMSGVIGAGDWSTASGQLRFYADGNLIYETPVITKESAPIEFTIDIKDANTVTVEAISQDKNATEAAISRVYMVMDLVSFHAFSTPPCAQYWLSELYKDENEPRVPTDEAVDMYSISVTEALTKYTWRLQGYRFFETWDVVFYDTGTFSATSLAEEQLRGTYSCLDEILTLFYKDGRLYGEFLYDSETQAFISTTSKVLIEHEYVDGAGVFHEAVYESQTLTPRA